MCRGGGGGGGGGERSFVACYQYGSSSITFKGLALREVDVGAVGEDAAAVATDDALEVAIVSVVEESLHWSSWLWWMQRGECVWKRGREWV